jgi:hypothetical protein
MNGAGRFFDERLNKYKNDDGNVPSGQSWPELETLMGEDLMSEAVSQAFKSVKTHRIQYIMFPIKEVAQLFCCWY